VALAPIVHNRHVVAKLQEAGLVLANSLQKLSPGDILVVPSHGMTVEALAAARERGIEVLDLTCPRVRRSQEEVRRLVGLGLSVLIVGDPGHTEVRSVASLAGGRAVVVCGVDAAASLPPGGRWGLVSQTTARQEDVDRVVAEVRARARELLVVPTSCQVAATMQETVRKLAGTVDAMIVIGGKTSANTANLAAISDSVGARTYHIEEAAEVDPSWLPNTKRVGIAAGASTPDWLIEEVVAKVKEIDERGRTQGAEEPAREADEPVTPEVRPTRRPRRRPKAAAETKQAEPAQPGEDAQAPTESAGRPEAEQAPDAVVAEAGPTEPPHAAEEASAPAEAGAPAAGPPGVEQSAVQASGEEAPEVPEAAPAATPETAPEVAPQVSEAAPQVPEATPEAAPEVAPAAAPEVPEAAPQDAGAAAQQPASMEGVRLLSPGDVVPGRVVEVRPGEGVMVDVGYKTEGFVPVSELAKRSVADPLSQITPGEEIMVQVLRFEGDEGTLILSKRRADEERTWGSLQAANASGEPVEGRVTQAVKGGLLVDVGVRAFLPASHVGTEFVRDLQPYVGKRIKAKVIEIDRKDRKVILSERSFLEAERKAKAQTIWDSVVEGSVISGVVKRLTDFGAFVDLGGVDGLLHISELAWGRVNHPSEVVHEGETIEVKVLRVDRERNRISLGKKQVGSDPWEAAAGKYSAGSVVTGKVVRLVPFGAFVQLEDGIDGLVHISQIADHRISKPEEVLQVGQEVRVKVLAVSQEAKRISLSIREAEQDSQRTDYRSYMAGQPSREVTVGEMLAARNAEEAKRDGPLAATEAAADRDTKGEEPK
jgi:4-hydroxy-3-methylbut-2-enyl diphosphate reductase